MAKATRSSALVFLFLAILVAEASIKVAEAYTTPPTTTTPPPPPPPKAPTPPTPTPPKSPTPPTPTPPKAPTPPTPTPPKAPTPPTPTPPKAPTPPTPTPPKASPPPKADDKDFDDLEPSPTGQEKARCKAKKGCTKTLVCPAQCPNKKPKQNKKHKGCHIDCSGRCEATCKWRKPNCNGYGSLCYDPRFVGGDGVMFYFHGQSGGNFAIVSDENLQINAHFIGTRPQGRTRDFTWVQALNVMFDDHNLVISAKKVSQWSDDMDALTVRFDGTEMYIPEDQEAEWGDERKVTVERTDEKNSIRVTVSGLVEMDIRVRPIGKQENLVHKYGLPENDAFAHLETQFKFKNLSDKVEGILGKTYRPGYVSTAKAGVPMPIMGGEDKYQTKSLMSPRCLACRFQKKPKVADI